MICTSMAWLGRGHCGAECGEFRTTLPDTGSLYAFPTMCNRYFIKSPKGLRMSATFSNPGDFQAQQVTATFRRLPSFTGAQVRVWMRQSSLRQSQNINDRVSEPQQHQGAEEDPTLQFDEEIEETQSTVAGCCYSVLSLPHSLGAKGARI